jgi:plasmid replication initiation protein
MAKAADFNQLDLFVAIASDISAKEQQDLMARSWFSLSKNKRTTDIYHEIGEDFIRVRGSKDFGIATVWDNDLLIFLISHLVTALNDGRKVSRRIILSAYEYYLFTGRKRTSGTGYADLWKSMERLHHTFVETSIVRNEKGEKGKTRTHQSFNWLSSIKRVEPAYRGGEANGTFEVVIAEWLFEAIENRKMVLAVDREYFQLKGGIDKWLYMFCRKSSGYQMNGWTESFESIYKKSASQMPRRSFTAKLRDIIEKQSIAGYTLEEVKKYNKDALQITRTTAKQLRG